MNGELVRGFVTQARVVYALALRETRTRFGQNRLGYVWALAEPSFFILTFWGMFYLLDRLAPQGLEIMPFLATGFVPYQLITSSLNQVGQSINSNKALLFYPHVQPLDLAFARGALELVTYGTVFTILVGGWCVVTQTYLIDDVLTILGGFVLSALLGSSIGLVLCALNVLSPTVERVKSPLMKPLFWISGLFFTANMIPSHYRAYLMWNPILHCVEIIRSGLFPQYDSLDASPGYVMVWITVMAFAGMTLERRVRPRVQLT